MKIIRKNRKKKGDCGVVAAFNASSWCNLYRPYKEIEKIAKSCGYDPAKGIYFFQFANLIKKLGLPGKEIKPKSLAELQTKLYLGKFFIFLYTATGDLTGHVIAAFMDHKGNIKLINPDSVRETWDEFAAEIVARGMRNFVVWEFPCRGLV